MQKKSVDLVKEMYGILDYKENECPLSMSDKMPKSSVFDLMKERNRLKKDIKTLTALLSLREAQINMLKAALVDRKWSGTSLGKDVYTEIATLQERAEE